MAFVAIGQASAQEALIKQAEDWLKQEGYRPMREVDSDGDTWLKFKNEGLSLYALFFKENPTLVRFGLALKLDPEEPFMAKLAAANATIRSLVDIRAYIDDDMDVCFEVDTRVDSTPVLDEIMELSIDILSVAPRRFNKAYEEFKQQFAEESSEEEGE